MTLLNGKEISQGMLVELKEKVNLLKSNYGRSPRLDILLVGDDFASKRYVDIKKEKGEEIGIDVSVHELDGSNQQEIISLIQDLNTDDKVDGIMVQLPLPDNLNEDEILSHISVEKDVDGLTAESLGKLFRNEECFVSATPKGIEMILDKYSVDIEGKEVVVIGRSKIVGLPISAVMLNRNATVTICHSYTKDLKDICKRADILISAIGKPNFITKEFLKDGVIAIDVGFNKDPNTGNIVGDIQYEQVKDIASYITPVPGGIGPMTIVSLLDNVIISYQK